MSRQNWSDRLERECTESAFGELSSMNKKEILRVIVEDGKEIERFE